MKAGTNINYTFIAGYLWTNILVRAVELNDQIVRLKDYFNPKRFVLSCKSNVQKLIHSADVER